MHLREAFASIRAGFDAHGSGHEACQAGGRLGERIQQRPGAVGSHLNLADRSVCAELDWLNACLAH